MDTSDLREIFIPQDAQVGSIPLWTIPDRLLDRMGVPRPSNNPSSSSCAPPPSPEGTWISPVQVRKRTHPAACGDPAGGSPFWAMQRALAAAQSTQLEIPFVTSNRLALEVLRDFLPGVRFSNPSRGPPSCRRLPRVSAPPLHQDGVVVYQGNVFLSIRRPKRRRGGEPPVAAPTVAPRALSPVSSVPYSQPASVGEPHQTERPPIHPAAPHQVPEDPAVRAAVLSETTSTPNTDHPEATRRPLFGNQDHLSVFVPPHKGRLETGPKNYRDYDFEALAMDEKIAQMKVKLLESEAALRRGCS